jgi:hypothetical protein
MKEPHSFEPSVSLWPRTTHTTRRRVQGSVPARRTVRVIQYRSLLCKHVRPFPPCVSLCENVKSCNLYPGILHIAPTINIGAKWATAISTSRERLWSLEGAWDSCPR